ncbi:MAG: choice-of-anchor D domain-containing protein [Deltaproteobacteria bacterium]|nr:choice-of-anchor D domain-containing protein [Deltaproteobacteria bacterium]
MRTPSFAVGLALLLAFAVAPHPAAALPSFYGAQCAGCHGATPNTCNGCHAHGTHASNAFTGINIIGTTNKTSYAPGETVTVTMNGGWQSGWIRAYLYDQNMVQLAVSTGPNGVGGGAGYPITFTAPAPSTQGSRTWFVAWYGNQVDKGGATFGTTWTPDATNANHGREIVATNTFSVAAPAAPAIALSPGTLNFGNVNTGASASLSSQIQNTGNATLTVTAIARCASPATSTEFTWTAPALPFTVATGASAALSVSYAPTAAGTDTGCIALTTNASNGPTTNLAVNGTGVVPAAPRIALAPTSLAFGNVTVGAPAARTFTISNTGTAALTGTVARATGTSTEYAVSPANFNVAAGGNQIVTVTYTPTGTGSDAGTIAVSSNDTTAPTSNVALTGTGVAAPAPSIALSPASLTFGTVTVGGSASLSAQVQNSGTAPLTVSAVARCASPATSAEFAWSPAAPFTVAAGGSTTVTVTYTPTAAGPDAGCLAFSSNDTANPTVNLNVSGTGQAAAAPKIAVAPAALAFGNVTVGSPSARTFTISNTGTATLTGTVARTAGTSTEYGASPSSFNVAAGGSQVVTVTYTPTDSTTDNGSITVSSNDTTASTTSVTLSGAGVTAPAPSIALTPATLSFGSVVLGSSATLTAQVRNAGTATLNVTGIALCSGSSPEFSWSPAAPLAIAPGQSTTLTVTYQPTAAGTDSGCLAIASNDTASPVVNLGVGGTGVAQAVPAVALSPTSLDFGTVTVGSSASRTTLVQNTGTGPLSVTGISLCAGTPATFSWSPSAPITVAAGQNATLTVSYKPTGAAADAGCIALVTNDPAKPTVNLTVTGAGSQPPVPSVDADIDIDELDVTGWVDTKVASTITPKLEVKNRSNITGTGSATLVGTIGGAEVYRQTIALTVKAREEAEYRFPPYSVAAKATGTLLWKVTVEDQDPDVDVATAKTVLGRRSGGDDGGAGSGSISSTGSTTADLTASATPPATGGCSSTGGSVGWLAFVGLGLLGVARRRRPGQTPRD